MNREHPDGAATFRPAPAPMDAEMIEKVARAMHAVEANSFRWEDEDDVAQAAWRALAVAAIAALSATPQADPWHEAVVNACMRVDGCYLKDDPARTMLNLEKWWYELGKEHSPAELYVPSLHGDFAAYMAAHQPDATPQAAQVPEDYERVLWGVVANAGRLSSHRQPRWAHVSAATGLGSSSSAVLCLRFERDPDEVVGGRSLAAAQAQGVGRG